MTLALYISPHADDVGLSCAARMVAEVAAGDEVVILSVFGAPAERGPDDPLRSLGVQFRSLGLPRAEERSPYYASFRSRAYGRAPEDEAWVGRIAEALDEVGRSLRAREVYVPLAVGGHIDHRLCHEAALRAFESGDGRNVFLYEERPEALVGGAVRMRLAHMGAQLPPGAAEAARPTGLAPFLLRFHLAPQARGEMAGWSDVLRSAGDAAREWRGSRRWHPLRSFGPRLQPVVQAADGEQLAQVRAVTAGRMQAKRLDRLALAYAKSLGSKEHAERYWLLLPARDLGQISA